VRILTRFTGAILLLATVALLVLTGCPPPPETDMDAGGVPELPLGPPRAVIVVDVSRSTIEYRDDIFRTVRLFLVQLQNEGDFDLSFIRLDQAPKEELHFTGANFSENELVKFEEVFSSSGPAGGGTDQVGAMRLALEYAQPQDVKPAFVKLLWFSDMHADDPTGRGGAFPKWGDFDWSEVSSAGIESAVFYYAAHEMALELAPQARAAGVDAVFIEPAQMENDLETGNVMLP